MKNNIQFTFQLSLDDLKKMKITVKQFFFLLSIPTILVYNVRLDNIEHTVNACNIYVTCLQIAHGVCAVSPQYQWT